MAGGLSAICKTPHTTDSWKMGKTVLISPNCNNSGLGSAFSHMIHSGCTAIAGITTDTRRASSVLGSLPRAFRRAPKAFNHSGKSAKVFSRHPEGFLRLLKAPKGSQWSHQRASEASGEHPARLEAFQGLFEGLQRPSTTLVEAQKSFQGIQKGF